MTAEPKPPDSRPDDSRPEWLKGVYRTTDGGDGGPEPEPLVFASLDKVKRGDALVPTPTLRNVSVVLDFDSRWVGKIRYDLFHRVILVHDEEVHDEIETEIALWLSDNYDINAPTSRIHEAVAAIARRHTFHPVSDYLESLVWDGTPRLDAFPAACLGTEPSALTSEMFRRWAISAVARILTPGCKVDTCLILIGAQGSCKSSALAVLTGREWFAETPVVLGSKDAFEQLSGVWVYELAELDSVRRAEASATKAFISAPVDHYRPSYGRNVVTVPRQCVFVGSTNELEFLSDPTGSRRFLPVRTGSINLERVREQRDQVWAEAVTLFRAGERWWLDRDGEAALAAASETYQQTDAWEDPIRAWLTGRTDATVAQVMTDALEIPKGQMKRADQMRVATILRRIGWRKERSTSGWIRTWTWYPPHIPDPDQGAGRSSNVVGQS